mmetsp:Transcript_37258/g.63410  ORF Transcript_37258/g.63410 Transcript_37258/m.63410 type:complete len:284 (+) Transcript_37258:468-1319(+)
MQWQWRMGFRCWSCRCHERWSRRIRRQFLKRRTRCRSRLRHRKRWSQLHQCHTLSVVPHCKTKNAMTIDKRILSLQPTADQTVHPTIDHHQVRRESFESYPYRPTAIMVMMSIISSWTYFVRRMLLTIPLLIPRTFVTLAFLTTITAAAAERAGIIVPRRTRQGILISILIDIVLRIEILLCLPIRYPIRSDKRNKKRFQRRNDVTNKKFPTRDFHNNNLNNNGNIIMPIMPHPPPPSRRNNPAILLMLPIILQPLLLRRRHPETTTTTDDEILPKRNPLLHL